MPGDGTFTLLGSITFTVPSGGSILLSDALAATLPPDDGTLQLFLFGMFIESTEATDYVRILNTSSDAGMVSGAATIIPGSEDQFPFGLYRRQDLASYNLDAPAAAGDVVVTVAFPGSIDGDFVTNAVPLF